MKLFVLTSTAVFTANVLAASNTTCCFTLTSSDGRSGPVGQINDGQTRIGDDTQPGKFCINSSGAIVDGRGRGCFLTPPTSQLQCDEGASPEPGFSIDSTGRLHHNGSTDFIACESSQGNQLNIYTNPAPQDVNGCRNVSFTANDCRSSGPSPGVPAGPAPAPNTAAPPPGPAPTSPNIPGAPAPAPVPSGPEGGPPSGSGGGSHPGPTAPGAPSSSGTSPPGGGPHPGPPGGPSPSHSGAPAPPAQPSSPECPRPVSPSGPEGPKATGVPPPHHTESSPPGGTSHPGPPTAPPPPSPSGGGCPTDLTSGTYEFPHLIIPIDSSSPSKARGTSLNGTVTSKISSIFNFDIPPSLTGKRCSLVFLFPTHDQLITSSFSFSGDGSIDFAQLQSPANLQTSASNAPAVKTDFGVTKVSPGHSYTITTFSCPAGEAVAYEMKNAGATEFEWFEDYNPAAIGLFITTC